MTEQRTFQGTDGRYYRALASCQKTKTTPACRIGVSLGEGLLRMEIKNHTTWWHQANSAVELRFCAGLLAYIVGLQVGISVPMPQLAAPNN